jgi:phosphate starvation-inducible PhoH-like protein
MVCKYNWTQGPLGSDDLTSKENLVSKRTNQARKERNVISFNDYTKRAQTQVRIVPRNLHQEDYLALLEDSQKNIIFALGPAGTGKTIMAAMYAVRELKAGKINKVIVTRPAVSVDEQHGFLPGTLIEKMAPWTRPVFDIFEQHWSVKTVNDMVSENVIEVAPLAYMRGRTFTNSIVIADEMQNATREQMKMLLTRIGPGSRIIVTGDLAQHDRGFAENGLKDFMEKLKEKNSEYLASVVFSTQDVERHPAVSEVLKIYGDA